MPFRATGKHQVLTRGQKQRGRESVDHSLYWGFHGKGKAGQGNQFRTDWLK